MAGLTGMAAAAPLVDMQDVHKSYRRGARTVAVLQGVSLQIAAGEFVALMGPSGSGKSTLLNLIAGIDRHDAGRIETAGVDIATLGETALAAWRAANVGFIFQFYNLIPVLTAFENVELPLLLTDLTRRERREHVRAALAMVNLEDRFDHLPHQLSGGQMQRVAIARALVTNPLLLVADEPTGDLDRATGNAVLALLEHLHQALGMAIVMVTHDPQAAARARRQLVLDQGVLVGHAVHGATAGAAG